MKLNQVLLLIILVMNFFLVLSINFFPVEYVDPLFGSLNELEEPYLFPWHADEWIHLAGAKHVQRENSLAFNNPYLENTQYNNLQGGFHSFNAALSHVFNFDLNKYYYLLSPIFSTFFLLTLFIFLRNYFGDEQSALLPLVFISIIENNINLTGLWFYLPFTFSLILLFLFLDLYINQNNKAYYLVFLALALVHPVTTTFLVATLLIHALLTKKIKKDLIYLILASFLIALLYFRFNLVKIINMFYFSPEWTGIFETFYSLPLFLGIIPFALAITGYYFFREKKLMLSLTTLPLFLQIFYFLFNFSVIIPYQRAFLLLIIMFSIMSGYGLSFLIKKINKKTNLLFTTAIILTFLIILPSYHDVSDERFHLIMYVEKEDYQAFEYAKENYEGYLIMTDPYRAIASYPVANTQTLYVLESNMGGGDLELVTTFFNSDCEEKRNILGTKDFVVISKININCDFLLNKKERFYEVVNV